MAHRGSLNSKGVWAAGGVAVAVLALTAVAMFNGSDGGGDDGAAGKKASASAGRTASGAPAPTYTMPDNWTEPAKWAALPRGERSDKYGSQVGFPHTAEGAMGLALAANSTAVQAGGRSAVDERLRTYNSYLATADRSTQAAKAVELGGIDVDKDFHQQAGVTPEQDLPSGAYMRNTPVGYKVIKAAPDEVSAWLLARVSTKTAETAKESVTYTVTVVGVRWEAGDWKLSVETTAKAQDQAQGQAAPEAVAPGDAAFNAAGWTAIREAS
ncbi:hypothetical protein GCM10010331_75000 [Streptomyces xanthochromogenes]|uniref:hypothetical protein n=1 Tax=Streptomyces xanthochromogenes TaxID=67384 RepID=UPI0016785B35|nr:hypothetical protein [Streptomyces xanthochromogenes]GHB76113.1 hypothetical protein GCM10010331_75000 [Streptomyces xanthochromogenes]